MSMFCFQCQETAKGTGCTAKGVCGKQAKTSNLMDLLLYNLKGIAVFEERAASKRDVDPAVGRFVLESLFLTITNVNFDDARVAAQIDEALRIKRRLLEEVGDDGTLPEAATWLGGPESYEAKSTAVGVLAEPNEDVRSLHELLMYGLKGIAAYADHAAVLGYEDPAIYRFAIKALSAMTRSLPSEQLVALVMEAGATAVTTMALLDKANTTTYGNPEITKVSIGVGKNPGILISGHDLRDLSDLLEQTAGTGVDVYTHGEMLPAHYYPAFKKYPHFAGNYGGAWYKQDKEFASFNGPILMTTNCLVPVRDSYRDRLFTTGLVGYPGIKHIPERPQGGKKDFSEIIALAKRCPAPTEIETGEIVGGFGHQQVFALADKVVEAVKSGAIKRFVVMAGCDGRMKGRDYFTQVAEALPKDAVILTAGCAKYRYNKLALGDIGGIPRVLDAGQCNDSYSLALIALKLKEVFGLDDINKLPLSFDLGWYEQKAVAVLLALLHLGVKNIRLGPTLPAFLSPNVAKVLVDTFGIRPTGTVESDIPKIMAGV